MSKKSAKTIQIFLPDGNARGIRIADITSRSIKVLQIPRVLLGDAASRKELRTAGLYCLFGPESASGEMTAYIGEAEECLARLKQHNAKKEFWNTALVAVSKTGSFTKVHGKYLEWMAIETANTVARYTTENASSPSKPHVTEAMEADLEDYFDTIRILFSTLGYPIFEPARAKAKKPPLHLHGRSVDAQGEFVEDGLLVFAGSKARLHETPTAGPWLTSVRADLVRTGVLVQEGDSYKFTKDHLFSAPSTAASVVLGRRTNGWISWKYPDNRTLDEVHRK